MAWKRENISATLHSIPRRLMPDDEVPDFHPLKARIARIERQHFALELQNWIEINAVWLESGDLYLTRSTRRSGPPFLVNCQQTFADQQVSPQRRYQLDVLVELLDMHSVSPHEAAIRSTVSDLNKIRWAPQQFRQVLAKNLPEVPNALKWLLLHSATRQAKSLLSSTPEPAAASRRPRF